MSALNNPPSAPLAFRVGVVGHRPNRLQHADVANLTSTIRDILTVIKNEVVRFQSDNPGLYCQDAPVMRAISPLAEGTDRIFAEVAIETGYDLCCIMPFHRNDFIKDFEPGRALEQDSLNRFQEILSKAEKAKKLTCFELDGSRKEDSSAYYHCSKTVLNQSDMLIVVWDGVFLGKSGGTENAFRDALRNGIPVVWIDAHKDHSWQIIENDNEFRFAPAGQRRVPKGESNFRVIRNTIDGLLQLTNGNDLQNAWHTGNKDKIDSQQNHLKTFYGKRKPWFTTAVIWKCFRDVFGDGKFPIPVFSLRNFEESLLGEWPEDESTTVSQMVNTLRPYYAWPDKLAVLYSDRYRSAFIITFSLAAIAVGLALIPLAFGWEPHTLSNNICIWIEIALMISIIAMVYFGRRNGWHERWIELRLLAESIRHLRLVAPLGGSRPFLNPPPHHNSYGQPEASWVAWYVRAVERFLGLPSVVVDKNHLQSSLIHLSGYIGGQIKYHTKNEERCGNIEKRLHLLLLVMLGMTIISCLIHLFMGILPHRFLPLWITPDLLTVLCCFCPAMGAALAGINNQGEFKRISKRSKAMSEQLRAMKRTVDLLITDIDDPFKFQDEQLSVKTSEITGKIARLMTNEVLDWRVVFLDRPLNAAV